MGCGIEPRNDDIAEAEAVKTVEGYMCATAMRGSVALPGSKATSRSKGTRRNLGGLAVPADRLTAVRGHDGKPSRRRSRRGSSEESDGVVVPVKRPNKAGMTGGGGRGGKDPARKEGGWSQQAPDFDLDAACQVRCSPAGRVAGVRSSH